MKNSFYFFYKLASVRLVERSIAARHFITLFYIFFQSDCRFVRQSFDGENIYFRAKSKRSDQLEYDRVYMDYVKSLLNAELLVCSTDRVSLRPLSDILHLFRFLCCFDVRVALAKALEIDCDLMTARFSALTRIRNVFFMNEANVECQIIIRALRGRGVFFSAFQHAVYPAYTGRFCIDQVCYKLSGCDQYFLWGRNTVNNFSKVRPNSSFQVIDRPNTVPASLTGTRPNFKVICIFLSGPQHKTQNRALISYVLTQHREKAIFVVPHPSDSFLFKYWRPGLKVVRRIRLNSLALAYCMGGTIFEDLKNHGVPVLEIKNL